MLKKIFFYYLILSIPNLFLFAPIFILKILKKNFSFKRIFSYFNNNKELIFLLSFLVIILILNLKNLLYFKEIQFYIILIISIFFIHSSKINFNNFVSLIFNINCFLFIYIITLIFFNNTVMNCIISRSGYYDIFQKVNEELIILNTFKFNCFLNPKEINFMHVSSLVFKILFLNFINFVSFIINDNKIKKLFNILILIFVTILTFSIGSRVALIINFFSLLLIFLLLIKEKNLVLIIFIFISLVIINVKFYNNKNYNLLNFFILNESSFLKLNKYHYTINKEDDERKLKIQRRNLSGENKITNRYFHDENIFNKKFKYRYFHNENIFNRMGKIYHTNITDFFDSERKFEIGHFIKYLKSDHLNSKLFYHNYFFNIYSLYGSVSVLLIIFLLVLFKKLILQIIKIFNLKNFTLNLFIILNLPVFFLSDAYFNSLPNYFIIFILLIYLIKDNFNNNFSK